jgi:hypothetical protein
MTRSSIAARLAQLEAQRPEYAWLHSEGLAALLAHAQRYPTETCDPLEGLEGEELRGLAVLLREARQRRATP